MKQELEWFNQLTEQLLQVEKDEPVAAPIPTSELANRLDLELNEDPISDDEFFASLQDLVMSTPRTASKSFFNQLFGGRNAKATLGELLATMLNNSMYTYKVGGPQVAVEKEIVKKVAMAAGFNNDFGGTISSGGSMSNLIAMLMARDKISPEIRFKGKDQQSLVAYTSKASHYSNKKNASFLGIGLECLRLVEVDELGRMSAADLELKIKADIDNGLTPFFVNCTAGTTVLGAFDPIREVTAVAKTYNVWTHVDGAYCGPVLFSDRFKHLVDGLETADSFNLNAHKMLGTPLTCSVIVVKDKKHIYDSLSMEADYLYQTDMDEYNLGKTSLQCGRRNNALKFWCLWKSVGTTGLADIVEKQMDLAEHARQYVDSSEYYTLYSFKDSISICFNYKDIDPIVLCTSLYEHAELMVGYGSYNGVTFVRLVTMDPRNEMTDIDAFFKTLEKHAAKYELTPVLAG